MEKCISDGNDLSIVSFKHIFHKAMCPFLEKIFLKGRNYHYEQTFCRLRRPPGG